MWTATASDKTKGLGLTVSEGVAYTAYLCMHHHTNPWLQERKQWPEADYGTFPPLICCTTDEMGISLVKIQSLYCRWSSNSSLYKQISQNAGSEVLALWSSERCWIQLLKSEAFRLKHHPWVQKKQSLYRKDIVCGQWMMYQWQRSHLMDAISP